MMPPSKNKNVPISHETFVCAETLAARGNLFLTNWLRILTG